MVVIEQVWDFVRTVLKSHKAFAMGHVNKKSIKGMTPLELSVSLRKCGDRDCHCEVVCKEQFDSLLRISDNPADFLNRLWLTRMATSYGVSEAMGEAFDGLLPFTDIRRVK